MKYYGVDDLAKMLNVNPETIKREVQRHKLQCFKVGTVLRFSQEHVDQYTNVMQFGKTTREIELEKEIENLKIALLSKEQTINTIKTEILKAV